MIITEGGASFPDAVGADGRVDDPQRIAYLAAHIAVAAEGVPGLRPEGYFVWTLLDNFEWAAGYTQRFGLVHVDFDDAGAHAQGVVPLAAGSSRIPRVEIFWLASMMSAWNF